MKLVKAHIDNFGCLHQQDFLFEEEGLSVYQYPNGFGKSTLSIFIKAMFYGLVGSSRSVDGNERKKYAPWQGGKFGGYLIYSHGDKTYRITRYFGKTKRDDTVELTNEATGRTCEEICATFSQEAIGVAVFGIDAESFAKTVFMPQGKVVEEYSTNSIEARLVGMIEAAGEDGRNGYDEAVERVKATRKTYKPFRGSGGKSADIETEITRLENDIASKEQSRILLDDVEEEIHEKEICLNDLDEKIASIREEILKASTFESNQMLIARRQELEARVEAIQDDLEKERAIFPARIPESEEIESILEKVNRLSALSKGSVNSLPVDSLRSTINSLEAKFSNGIPDEQELEKAFEACSRLTEESNVLEQNALSDLQTSELKRLQTLFDQGLLSEEVLAGIDKLTAERNKLQGVIEANKVSEASKSELSSLKSFFRRGVPDEETIIRMESNLDDADALRQRSSEKLEEAFSLGGSSEVIGRKTSGISRIALIVVAVAMFAVAIVSFSLSFAVSIGCAALAIACAFGAVFSGRGKTGKSEKASPDPRLRQQADELKQRADALTEEVREFVERYIADGRPLRPALMDIRVKAATLTALTGETASRERVVSDASDKIAQCENAIISALGDFYREGSSYDLCASNMRNALAQLETLTSKASVYESMAEKAKAVLEGEASTVIALLSKYNFHVGEGDDLRDALVELKTEASRYSEASKTMTDVEKAQREVETKEKRLHEELTGELRSLGFSGIVEAEQILNLRDARKSITRLEGNLAAAKREQDAFFRDNPQAANVSDADLDELSVLGLEDATVRESQLISKRNTASADLDVLRSRARELFQDVADVAVLRDELDDARCARNKIEGDLEILDTVIELLGTAKESLSLKYQGPVASAFNSYSELVFDDSSFRVDESLSVSLEYKGSFKEAAYLSAGVADMVAICMRMALADALFGEEGAFILLDDPFTNLDNEHMAKALDLLNKLAGNRQIVYLTCHSSRVPEW